MVFYKSINMHKASPKGGQGGKFQNSLLGDKVLVKKPDHVVRLAEEYTGGSSDDDDSTDNEYSDYDSYLDSDDEEPEFLFAPSPYDEDFDDEGPCAPEPLNEYDNYADILIKTAPRSRSVLPDGPYIQPKVVIKVLGDRLCKHTRIYNYDPRLDGKKLARELRRSVGTHSFPVPVGYGRNPVIYLGGNHGAYAKKLLVEKYGLEEDEILLQYWDDETSLLEEGWDPTYVHMIFHPEAKPAIRRKAKANRGSRRMLSDARNFDTPLVPKSQASQR
ncbi:hypothetical protein B0T16DRAFT_387782 [Cercophora newfieldiana]|uniref:Uncharacterized protein n=1 Tax=Cercophora newfieldiana TaxID=92897 RepID=A0AA39YH48_9PEZI|nr:hypothetical protein B0T16DRAFT_387782 [Cercophora newfieldiana]